MADAQQQHDEKNWGEGHRLIPVGEENGPAGLAVVLEKPTISIVQGVKSETEMYKPDPMTSAEREALIARKRHIASARK